MSVKAYGDHPDEVYHGIWHPDDKCQGICLPDAEYEGIFLLDDERQGVCLLDVAHVIQATSVTANGI
jgi:hypothetical protein